MRSVTSSKARVSWTACVAGLSLTLLVAPGLAQPQYSLTEIPAFALPQSAACGINQAGHVVGYVNESWHSFGFLWVDGGMTLLRPPQGSGSESAAYALNDHDQVVGTSYSAEGTNYAVSWQADSGHSPYALVRPDPYQDCWAIGINDGGDILVQMSSISQGPSGWYLKSEQHGVQVVDSVPMAFGLNAQAQVCCSGPRSYKWESETLTDLGLPEGCDSQASAINDAGLIVGTLGLPGPQRNILFMWRDGALTYPFTGNPADTYGVGATNSREEVVGYVVPAGQVDPRAILFSNGVMYDLNDCVPPGLAYTLQNAVRINNAGQIVGVMYKPDTGDRGYILTPHACAGFARCDANCDGQTDFDDINPFVLALSDARGYAVAYPACNWLCNLDTNWDGVVDFNDISAFVACLSARPGCI